MLRELVCKTLVGIVIPLLLVMARFEYRDKSVTILFEAIRKGIAIMVVLVISLAVLLIARKAWWDLVSGTTLIRQKVSGKRFVRRMLIGSNVLALSAAGVVIYPFFEDIGNIKHSYYPRYPVTGEVRKYADFIHTNGRDPVDYVFDLFDRYDIVVISERLHPEYTQYELVTRIIHDPRFIENVGNLFTECGSVSFQDTLNTLLRTSFTSADSLDLHTALLQRNSNAIWPLWDNTNLFDLFENVNRLNEGLPDSAKINWYFTDRAVDWRGRDHQQFVAAYTDMQRDSFMARQVINRYSNQLCGQRRHKALVIMNTRHAYGLAGSSIPRSFLDQYRTGTAAYLVRRFPDKVATVMINTVSIRYGYAFTPIQRGKWDAAFSLAGNPNAAFDFTGSPFGNDVFDAASVFCPTVTYKDVFTGFIFYKPLKEHFEKSGFAYELDGFEDSVIRRASAVDQSMVNDWTLRIARYEKNKQSLIVAEPVAYAILINLAKTAPMLALITLGLILNLLFAFIGYKTSGKGRRIITSKGG
jgi:hypothetical protein